MSNTSKLRLDFSIPDAEGRKQFLDNYLSKIGRPLNEDELEMCGNYLLWGKNTDGRNEVQEKNVQIKTRFGTWDNSEPESLDALMEQPTFNETQLLRPGTVPRKIPRETFSRKEALEKAPAHLVPLFTQLFGEIDRLDLLINYYDLAHGKRKNEPREGLIQKFTQEERLEIHEESTHLNQYQYLKKRHELVELRRQQFTLRDSFVTVVQPRGNQFLDAADRSITIGAEIEVRPMGLKNKSVIGGLVFRDSPEGLSKEDLEVISHYLWERGRQSPVSFFDFREEEHILELFGMWYEIYDAGLEEGVEGTLLEVLDTLQFYVDRADLSETQLEILELKKKKLKNQEIADFVNQKYGKTYSANYISTIFRQKIVGQITEAAKFHEELVGNFFFAENFKKCTGCGRLLLIDGHNFIRKTRAKDGFANRCKLCDRLERQKKKR